MFDIRDSRKRDGKQPPTDIDIADAGADAARLALVMKSKRVTQPYEINVGVREEGNEEAVG